MTALANTPSGYGGRSLMRRLASGLFRIAVGVTKVIAAALGSLLAMVGATQNGAATVSCVVLVTAAAGAIAYERECRLNCTPVSAVGRREVATWVLMAAVAVLAVAGAAEIAGAWSGALVAAVCTAVMAGRWRRHPVSRADAVAAAAPTVAPGPGPRDGVRIVRPGAWQLDQRPMAELIGAWRHSFLLLSTAAGDPFRLAQVSDQRRAYLDEMARRDPEGFQRWIDSGVRAAGDPSRYLTVDPPIGG